MSVDNRESNGSNEIESAERAVDVADAAMNAAREQMRKAAETLRQAHSSLVMVQEKHGIPVPQWPEHSLVGHRWWAVGVRGKLG